MNLYPFQKIGVEKLCMHTRYLIASDPGLGKTCQLINAVKVLQRIQPERLNVLVVCPKSMIITWGREVDLWGGRESHWTVINHDRLITKDFALLCRNWDVIIYDEAHLYLKNIDTKRAKACFVLNDLAKVVWLSTATPASKSAEDYYCMIKILLPSLKVTLSKFRAMFCNEEDAFIYTKKPLRKCKSRQLASGMYENIVRGYSGFKNVEKLKEIFSKCAVKHKTAEVASELPSLTISDYAVSGSVSVSKKESDDILDYVSKGIEPPPHYQEVLKKVGLAKIPSVIELLSTYPSDVKVVIFAWHRDVVKEMVEAIRKETDREVGFITGEVTSANLRQTMMDSFQTGSLNVLVMNMQSGGVGITLTAATKGIYLQFPYTADHWIQSQKRIHRIGSKKPVQIVKVMIEKSIDEHVFGILEGRVKGVMEVGV